MTGYVVRLKLVLTVGTSRKCYRTVDNNFQIIGEDLNCTSRAARRAGAGPVWTWRLNRGHWDFCSLDRSFGSKKACLADLLRSGI